MNESRFTKLAHERLARLGDSKYSLVVRELCAAYDYMCSCPATSEARNYIKGRVEHYLFDEEHERDN